MRIGKSNYFVQVRGKTVRDNFQSFENTTLEFQFEVDLLETNAIIRSGRTLIRIAPFALDTMKKNQSSRK